MAKESTLTLTLKVDDQGTVVLDKFTKSIQKASDDVGKMSKAMQVVSVAAFINIAQQAINAGEQVYNFARSIASAGNDIQRMSRVFNMTTEEFQKWSYVTKMADVDMEGFGQGFKFLTRSLSEALQGSGDAYKAFNLLGISLKDVTGRTKDQQTVMMETIGALEKYADGVNRDSLMLAIFGRGWMSIKPLVDQGTKAIEANRQEAERLNTILGKDVIKSLSESEDSFKRWSMTWNVAKMEIFEPLVKILGSMIERILALKKAWAEGGIGGVYRDIIAAQEAEKAANRPAAASGTLASLGITLPYSKVVKKPEAPGLIDQDKRIKELLDVNKDWRDSLSKQALVDERMAWAELGNEMAGTGETFDQMLARQKALKEVLESSVPLYETVKEDWGAIGNELVATAEAYGITVDELLRIRDVLDSGIKDNAHFVDSLKEISKTWNDFGQTIADNFNTMFVDTLTNGFKNMGDAFKKFCNSLLNSFVSAIGKMIVEWALFQTTTTGGETKKSFLGGGSGLGTVIGWLGSIVGLQEGGIFNRPTPAVVGEAGPEAVIPLKGGKIPIEGGAGGGNTTVIMYIEATDVDSFERKYGGSVTKIIHRNKKSAMARI